MGVLCVIRPIYFRSAQSVKLTANKIGQYFPIMNVIQDKVLIPINVQSEYVQMIYFQKFKKHR